MAISHIDIAIARVQDAEATNGMFAAAAAVQEMQLKAAAADAAAG